MLCLVLFFVLESVLLSGILLVSGVPSTNGLPHSRPEDT